MNEDNLFVEELQPRRSSFYVKDIPPAEDPAVKITDKKTYYEFKQLLGEGAFCKVYKALYKPTGEELAVKVGGISFILSL